MDMKNDLVKYKTLMVKSNYIIEASYKLNLQEQRLIYILTTKIEKDDTQFKSYRFTQSEVNNILSKHKITFRELSQNIDSLRNKELIIKTEKSVLQMKWLSSRETFNNGDIELCFDIKLKPYLLQLKDRFTKLSLNEVVTFNSNYSCRIYELLKQYEGIGNRIISIESLRSMFCIKVTEYSRYNDFKRKVILQAQKEINSNNTDINFTFQEIKTGKKVTAIKFYIKQNKASNEIKIGSSLSEVAATKIDDIPFVDIKEVQSIFTKHKITELEANYILKDANNNIDLIKQCYDYASNKNINNITGYIRTLVKGFKKPQANIQTDLFNDYPQRTYDFDDLEKKLLGWNKFD